MLNRFSICFLCGLILLIFIPAVSAYGPWWENLTAGGTYIVNYTANATFEVPTGVTSIEAVVVGGGGGGETTNSAGGGGAGGAFRKNTAITVVPLENLTIVIGGEGAAGDPGQDGGNTTIRSVTLGMLLQAAGGGGGTVAANRSQYGTSTTITGTVTGGDGGMGGSGTGNVGCGGGGGAGGWTGRGGAGGVLGANAGSASTGAGGGGGGASGTGGAKCGGGGGVGIGAIDYSNNNLNNGTGGGTSTTAATAGTNGSQGSNGTGMAGGAYGGGGGGDDVGSLTTGTGGNGAAYIKFTMPIQLEYNLVYPYTGLNEVNVTKGAIFNITVNATCRTTAGNCPNVNFSLPYAIPITNCTDLQNMNKSLSATYYLTNNIDCSDTVNWDGGAGFDPVGPSSKRAVCTVPSDSDTDIFKGNLNGNYYNISNLYISRPTSCYIGLFGYVYNSSIKNVGMKYSNISGKNYVGNYFGRSDTSGFFVNNFVEHSAVYVQNSLGGVLLGNVASSSGMIINNSYVKNSTLVARNNSAMGLLVGSMSVHTYNSYAQGKIIILDGNLTLALGLGVGGLIGRLAAGGSIFNSYSDVNISYNTVTSINKTGGLVGYLATNVSFINNSFATGSINNFSNCVAGLVAYSAGTGLGDGVVNASNSFWNNLSAQDSANPPFGRGVAGCTGAGTITAVQNNISYFTYSINNSPMANWTAANRNFGYWSTSKDTVALPITHWEYIMPPRTGYVYNITWMGYKAESSWLPFFSNDSNPRAFSSVTKDATQIVIFYINASGDTGGTYDYWSDISSMFASGVYYGINATRHFNVTIQEPTAPPGNTTCNYSGSGNWVINCSDNCETSIAVDVGGNNVIINGTGIIRIRADIYNIASIYVYGTNTVSRCTVYCLGGCFKKW